MVLGSRVLRPATDYRSLPDGLFPYLNFVPRVFNVLRTTLERAV